MNDKMNREEIRQLADNLGYPVISDSFVERVEERLNCHYGAADPMATFVIQSAFIEEELRALRGDVRREAEDAAKAGASEGARAGVAEGVKSSAAELTSSSVRLSGQLQAWLDKGYVELTANTKLMRSIQEQIGKGTGLTLKVDHVALSPRTRRELVAAIPEATVRAMVEATQRSLSRANCVILWLMLFLTISLTTVVHQLTSRPTEKTIRWAATETSTSADKVIEKLLADRKLDPHATTIPRNVAVIGARHMADRVAELALGEDVQFINQQRSWRQRFWGWAATHHVESVIISALATLFGFLAGKGWR